MKKEVYLCPFSRLLEQAVVTFEKAIAVDEKSVEAYIGLADAYAGKGNSDKVKEVLKTGYEKTGDQILLDKEEAYSASVADETGEAGGTEGPAADGDSGADSGDGAASITTGASGISISRTAFRTFWAWTRRRKEKIS